MTPAKALELLALLSEARVHLRRARETPEAIHDVHGRLDVAHGMVKAMVETLAREAA